MMQQMLAIWSLILLHFLNVSWIAGSSWFMYFWSLAWRILSITLLDCEMSAIVQWFDHSLALPFFGFIMKTDLFQSCDHCWVFQICWRIECSTFTASYFGIWNSWTGIPSPPLALFAGLLPKAHLTSHSGMSDSWWVITPSWLSRLWRCFLYSSSLFYYHLFLISSASFRSIPFLSFIEPIFAWNVPLVSLILPLVFPIVLFSSISLHWSLRKAFLSLLAIFWKSAFRCLEAQWSSSVTSWQIDGEKVETVKDIIFLAVKITADGDYNHEIKRCLLLGIRAVTNLDSILKSRDIILLTKVHVVKTMVSFQ